MNARHCLPVTLLVCAMALISCDSGGPSAADKSTEAHLAAVANAMCSKSRRSGASSDLSTELATFRHLIRSDRRQPRVATFISDLDALHEVLKKGGTAAYALSFLEDSYRLDVKIRADEKALGLTSCIGSPPRKPIEGQTGASRAHYFVASRRVPTMRLPCLDGSLWFRYGRGQSLPSWIARLMSLVARRQSPR